MKYTQRLSGSAQVQRCNSCFWFAGVISEINDFCRTTNPKKINKTTITKKNFQFLNFVKKEEKERERVVEKR